VNEIGTKDIELGELHKAIAKRLKLHVNDVESDPRYVQMAIKFLNDNKIYCVPSESNELGELDKALEKRKQRFGGNIVDIAERTAKAMGDE
jgi:hypothetical protein